MEANVRQKLVTMKTVLFLVMVVASRLGNALDETDPQFWRNKAEDELLTAVEFSKHNTNRAEALIMFLGDGFSIATLTASRIFKGQLQGKPGEETTFAFERFPHFGFSKTYNTDSQVSDSAGTATAYLSGVKTKRRMIGLDAGVNVSVCQPITMAHKVDSIAKMAKEAGMAVGLVTTARITHASPAGMYAHTPERNWESSVPADDEQHGCKDIALQLIESDFDMDVVLGGGRVMFMPNTTTDLELTDFPGLRLDGRNLIEEWKAKYRQKGKADYVWNLAQFDQIDPYTTDFLLGLFNYDHMEYDYLRSQDIAGEPSIAEMTEKAIRLLRRKNKRFFLFVEGGRIDHGNHENSGYRAVTDTVAFEAAVQKALDLTNDKTLIVLTADHGHVLSIAGYPPRGHKILGKLNSDDRGLSYTTLNYANGFHSLFVIKAFAETGERPNITNVNTADPVYAQQSLVPLLYETHGGEDVAIFAKGPMSHLFHSVHEQNYITHVMQYAACIGDYLGRCHTADPTVAAPKTPRSGCRACRGGLLLTLIFLAGFFLVNE